MEKKKKQIELNTSKIKKSIDKKLSVQKPLVRNETRRTALKLKGQLKDRDQWFRLLVQNSYDIIMIFSVDGIIVYQSPSIEQVLGYSPDERIGKSIFGDEMIVHPDDMHLKIAMIKESLIYPERKARAEFRLKHKDGSWRYMEAICINMVKEPNIKGLVANYRDITDRQMLDQQKDAFIGIASHELKTPLTSAKIYSELLIEKFHESGDSEAKEMVEKLEMQIEKLTALANKLLDVTKITGGQMHFKETAFDLNSAIKEVVEEMQLTSQTHLIKTNLGLSAVVVADQDRFAQVLTNLISNAIKYSPQADKIIITSEKKLRNIKICVQDFGIGIKEDMQGKIFERFFRIHDARNEAFPGMGIGLFISSEIVKRMGGTLTVKSAKDKGSVFCFAVPLRPE